MITQEKLKEILSYDPETGFFTWNKRSENHFKSHKSFLTWNSKHAGKTAGSKHKKRSSFYVNIGIFWKIYSAHRLAFLYMTGDWPKHQVDHIDGDGLNNKWCNLRDVKAADNLKNLRLRVKNKSGCHGVYYRKELDKWAAKIGSGVTGKHLGLFASKEAAISARRDAEIKYNYHENHGEVRPISFFPRFYRG